MPSDRTGLRGWCAYRAISALRFTYVKIPKVQIAKILKVPLRNCRICTKQISSQGNFRWRIAKILTITENHRDLNTEIARPVCRIRIGLGTRSTCEDI